MMPQGSRAMPRAYQLPKSHDNGLLAAPIGSSYLTEPEVRLPYPPTGSSRADLCKIL